MLRFPCLRQLAASALLIAVSHGAEPDRPRVLRLTFEQAVQAALSGNFDIEVQRFEPRIAEAAVVQSLGRFDPVFDIGATRESFDQRGVFNDGVELQPRLHSKTDNLTSGISGVTSWGTKYDFGYGTRGNNLSSTVFGDDYRSTGSIGLTQPLLRGAGSDFNLAEVRIARKDVKISEWDLRQRIIDVITKTEFTYNELHYAIGNLHASERSRALAQRLLQDNQSRMEIGVKSPLDVTEARAQVAAREEAVILAGRTVLDNENVLKQLMSGDVLQLLAVRVEIEPPPVPDFREDVRAGIASALRLRPEYRAAVLRLEQQHIRVAVKKNELLPRIDLTGSVALLGLDNDFGGSLSNLSRRDRTDWSAGVVFSIPLGNRAARGAYSQAQLEAVKQLLALNGLEQQIIVEVDNASGQITTGRQRILSNEQATRLAKETLDAGEERLRAGTGTTFEVLDLQEKLARAEVAELRARADYNNAIGEYHRKTGTSLEVHNVVLK